MKDAKQNPDGRMKVSIPFEGNESELFKKYLKTRGLKIGGFIRYAALSAMRQESDIQSGKTQINIDAFRTDAAPTEAEIEALR